MNYNEIAKMLEDASIFDLWRVNCVVSQMMEDPGKIKPVKMQLTPGMAITYFASEQNRLVEATVLEIKRTRVLVEDKHNKKRWRIPYYMINLDNLNTDINLQSTRRGVSKTDLKVGDNIGWLSESEGGDLFGEVIRLNPKRAKIRRTNGEVWTVGYSLIFLVHEGQSSPIQATQLIEGEVV